MLAYLARRVVYTVPILFGVSLVCFALVHIAPGDPLVSVLPPDASVELQRMLRTLYGFDRSYPEQFVRWLWRAFHGDLGTSIATGRPVTGEVMKAVGFTLRLSVLATAIGFFFGCLFGFVAGYFRDSLVDRAASALSVLGVSVPHYWLGMVLVIIFSSVLGWLPPTGAGDEGGPWDSFRHMILPAVTMSVIPMGIVARTVRALVADILAQEFVVGLRAKGLTDLGIFRHVVKNAAPTALAVMGLQLGYLLGGSILIETVFSWPGTGFLLNAAIFQRDLPLLQGTILVLALFFVILNLLVDVVQTSLDPRIQRS
ncbi:ABC transporter permease [uncultured Enterovirga sp.]|uniref:ABC transporter permease n=1 Tax=uncultured Enterovirga sp. TaxID=2026352 RepID=UPI0035CC0F7B